MTTFKTGNPVGSTQAKDLYDNAENLDVLTNDRTKRSHEDRLGVPRKTWHGMEQDFQDFLIHSGYQQIGDYAAGLEITARNQVFWKDGELYRVGASIELPYTTTGVWDGQDGEAGLFVAVGDQVLRQQLADRSSPENGAAMVALRPGGSVSDAINYLTPEMFGAVGDGSEDDSASFRSVISASVSLKRPIVFRKGAIYKVPDEPITTLTGNVDVEGNGATVVGSGFNSIFKVDGSVRVNNLKAEHCRLLDMSDLSGVHDHLYISNVDLVDGQIINGYQTDTSLYLGFKEVRIFNCRQDNDGFQPRRGLTLFLRSLGRVSIRGCYIANSYRQGIIVGQNDAVNFGNHEFVEVVGNHIKKVRNLGGAESQGIETNDAYVAWIERNLVTDVAFDSSVPLSGCEGIYIRGGQNGYVLNNTLSDAGGGQGNILLKCRRFGLVHGNSIINFDLRTTNGISGFCSKHSVVGNQIDIYGTPEGGESRGIFLMYEDGGTGIGAWQDSWATDNKIYMRGLGPGDDIGIDVFFGNKPLTTRCKIDNNLIIGNTDHPILHAIKLSSGGDGAYIGSGNYVRAAENYVDVYSEFRIDRLVLRGQAENVRSLVSLRGSVPYICRVLEIHDFYLNNTLSSLSNASLVEANPVEQEIISSNNSFTGFFQRAFNSFAGSRFLSKGDMFRPSTSVPDTVFFRVFGVWPVLVKIFDGDFRNTASLVAVLGSGGGIGHLWITGNDLIGVSTPTAGGSVTKVTSSNNLGKEVIL